MSSSFILPDLQLAVDKTDVSLLSTCPPRPPPPPRDASDWRGSLYLRAERNRYPESCTTSVSPLQPLRHVRSIKLSLYNPTLLVLAHLTIFARSSLCQSRLIWKYYYEHKVLQHRDQVLDFSLRERTQPNSQITQLLHECFNCLIYLPS